MINKAARFSSVLLMVVLFLLCVHTQSPFSPENAKIYLFLKDSKGLVDFNSPVTEAVTDTVWVGVCAYLNTYIDSVSVTINNGLAGDSQFTIKKFNSDLDTVWHDFEFFTTGTRGVIATPYINGKKESSLQANITIVGKPISAAISPKSPTIKVDSSVTFVVNASGTGTIAYQWYRNDTVISGGSGQAFVIKPASISNSGNYKCKVTDQWGDSAFSDTAILTVFRPNAKPVLSITNSRLKILTTDTCFIHISVTDPDSGQTDSISIVKAPPGYAYKDFLFSWIPPAGYLGTDSVRTDSVIFAAIDNGSPQAVDTLVARIEVRLLPVNFSVSYNGNGNTGGTVPTDTNAYSQGATATVKGNTGTLVKTGYTFVGWNTAADGSGTKYVDTSSLKISNANVVLYAMWVSAASTAKALTAFSFANPSASGTINESAKTVAVTVPFGTSMTALVATFTTTGASVKVGSTVQTSGTTTNDFSNPVTYTVTAGDGSTQTYAVTVTAAPNTSKALTAFGFTSPSASGTINESAKTVAVTVPFGTSLTALVATFTTTGASVKVGSVVQVSGTTPNDFTNPVSYIVTAGDGSTQTYAVTVTAAPNTSKALTAFGFASPAASGTINESAKTVAVTVPFGTSLTALVATFTTTGASVKVGATVQTSGTTLNDFTNPVSYTVTAADGSTQAYTVTVTVAPNTSKTLTAFSFASPAASGAINESAKTVAVTVPFGTNLTALVATFTTTGASVKIGSVVQISGTTLNDFTNPVTYVVTAADGSTQNYVVTVTVGLNSAKAITAFGFTTPTVTGTINESAKTVLVTVPFGTAVTALAATITTTGASVKVGSTLQTSGTTTNDFTNPVTYIVTAADGSTQSYVVTVTVALNPAKAITAFSFASLGTGTIGSGTIAVTVPFGTAVTALAATFITTGASVKVGSTVQTSGTTTNDFTNPVTYIVTAADGSTHNYVVTVTIAPPDPPNITTNPSSITVIGPATATFTVAATGVSTLQYQWQKNNVNISGAASSSYTTPATTASDNGSTFRCVVTNSGVSSTSSSATLTVQYTVTYSSNVSSSGTAPATSYNTANSNVTVAANSGNLARTAFFFDGWNTQANGFGTTYAAGSGTINNITSNVVLYAKWVIHDIDGNVYHAIQIGSQIWMLENLKTTHLKDGTPVNNWAPMDQPDSVATYGLLYDFGTGVKTGNLAPEGWHVPTDAEWSALSQYLGQDAVSGGKLKEAGTTHWNTPNTGATNSSGFTALPAGYRSARAGQASNIGTDAQFWSSTERSVSPYGIGGTAILSYDSGATSLDGLLEDYGLSVRCILGNP